MPKAKQTIVPDVTYDVDRNTVLDAVDGPAGERIPMKDRPEMYKGIATETLVAGLAIFERKIAELAECKEVIKQELLSRSAQDLKNSFGKESPTVCVRDKKSNTILGGVRFSQEEKSIYSTERTKNADEVKDALKKANQNSGFDISQLLETQERLNNSALFAAFRGGALPAEVSNLLSESTTIKKQITYVNEKNLKGE